MDPSSIFLANQRSSKLSVKKGHQKFPISNECNSSREMKTYISIVVVIET